MIDIIGRQQGWRIQQSDVQQAYNQSGLHGTETWIFLPSGQWPNGWESKYRRFSGQGCAVAVVELREHVVHSSPPAERLPHKALQALLQTDSGYEESGAGAIAMLDPGRASLPEAVWCAHSVSELFPPRRIAMLEQFQDHVSAPRPAMRPR